jgi:hypothetical protein
LPGDEEVRRDVATVIVRVGWNFGLSNFVITSRGEVSRGRGERGKHE